MRNVANVFPSLDQNNLSAILLHGGSGRRLRSFGNRALLDIGDKTLLQHQLFAIRDKFPSIKDIVVGGGFDADKVYKSLPGSVRFVENENFGGSNAIRTLSLALKVCITPSVLIALGDIFFTSDNLRFDHKSALLVDSGGQIETAKVGLTLSDGKVSHLAYGLSRKWAGIGIFHKNELELLKRFCHDPTNGNLCMFEAINFIISKGGNFYPVETCGRVREINTLNDIKDI